MQGISKIFGKGRLGSGHGKTLPVPKKRKGAIFPINGKLLKDRILLENRNRRGNSYKKPCDGAFEEQFVVFHPEIVAVLFRKRRRIL